MIRVVSAAIILMISGGAAHAQSAEGGSEGLSASYLYDGGAVPLLWLPALGSLAVDHWVKVRDTPFYFDANDGGATRAKWEVPIWTVHAGVGVLGAAIALGGDKSRWYHVKGLAEAMATSSLVVSVLKPLVGRHRPDWVIDSSSGGRTSFPSGHTTNAFLIATYAAMYLNGHVFDRKSSALLQGASYAGLFLGASMIGGERIYHQRHHLTDVMAGALIGTASAYTMYRFQERRYRNGDGETNPEGSGWRITPGFSQSSATIGISGAF